MTYASPLCTVEVSVSNPSKGDNLINLLLKRKINIIRGSKTCFKECNIQTENKLFLSVCLSLGLHATAEQVSDFVCLTN